MERSFGQIGTKATPEITKSENVALQERQERQQALAGRRRDKQGASDGQLALGDRDQGQAGPDEAASDTT